MLEKHHKENSLLPTSFDMALEEEKEDLNIRYADDTVLIADSEEKLKALVQKVSEHSEAMGIKINRKKTKTMVITKKIEAPQYV